MGRREGAGHWSEKASDDHQHWLAAFIAVNGDKPITDYAEPDGLRFKGVLTKLPANASKVSALHGLPIAEAAATAAEMGLEPMSIATYNKAMAHFGSFFKWAKPNVIEEIQNPVDGMRQKDPVWGKDKRDPIAPQTLPSYSAARFGGLAGQNGFVHSRAMWS